MQHSDPQKTQLRNALATIIQDLRNIRLGRLNPLSIEITTHIEFAEELLAEVDGRDDVARIGGAA